MNLFPGQQRDADMGTDLADTAGKRKEGGMNGEDSMETSTPP